MSLLAIRDAVVDEFQAATELSQLKTLAPHGGRFDIEELRQIAAKAPALFVAILQVSDTEEGSDGLVGDVQFGAYVVTKDHPGQERDVGALALVQAVGLRIVGNRWGLDAAEGRPERIRADNLYGQAIDKHRIAMWGITWRQRMVLGGELDPATLDALQFIDVTYDLDPDSEAEPEHSDSVGDLQDA